MQEIRRKSDIEKLNRGGSDLTNKEILNRIEPYVSDYGLNYAKKLLKESNVRVVFLKEIYDTDYKCNVGGICNFSSKEDILMCIAKSTSNYQKSLILIHELGHAVIYFYEDRYNKDSIRKLINDSKLIKPHKAILNNLTADYIVNSLMFKKSVLTDNIMYNIYSYNNFNGKLPNMFDAEQLFKKVIDINNRNLYLT
jgi:hypothetical protein